MQTQGNKDEKKNAAPPATGKPTDTRPPASELGKEQKAARTPRQVFIVYTSAVGTHGIAVFKNRAAAEEFLNSPGAPTDYDVIVGHKIEKKQKVSLR